MNDTGTEIAWLSAAELARLYAARELSPVEVAEYALGRIDARDAGLNAFCHLDAAVTMAMAEESEARWLAGEALSPLDGVPVAIKDLCLTRGWPTLKGSRTIDPRGPWMEDAPAVARLREAGCVFVGKTTTPEFGHKGVTDSPLTGITRNPWNPKLTPGGSSGGSAAAVAAGFAPLALGTDGGGSVRIPAAFTGTVGMKAHAGRVPAWPPSAYGLLAHTGPHARTVHDTALMLDVIAQPDARDPFGLPPAASSFAAGLDGSVKGLRIAFSPRLGYAQRVDPAVAAIVAAAVRRVEAMGAIVEEADPGIDDPVMTFWMIWTSGAYTMLRHLDAEGRALLDPSLQEVLAWGEKWSVPDAIAATHFQKAEHASRLRRFMEGYDLLVCPTVATVPFAVGQNAPLGPDGKPWAFWSPFTMAFNLSGQPAISVNAGFTADGLPVGLQIAGRWYDDSGVLRAAAAFERATGPFAPPAGF